MSVHFLSLSLPLPLSVLSLALPLCLILSLSLPLSPSPSFSLSHLGPVDIGYASLPAGLRSAGARAGVSGARACGTGAHVAARTARTSVWHARAADLLAVASRVGLYVVCLSVAHSFTATDCESRALRFHEEAKRERPVACLRVGQKEEEYEPMRANEPGSRKRDLAGQYGELALGRLVLTDSVAFV